MLSLYSGIHIDIRARGAGRRTAPSQARARPHSTPKTRRQFSALVFFFFFFFLDPRAVDDFRAESAASAVRAPQLQARAAGALGFGNHRAQQITVPEPGPSGGPVQRELGSTEVSASYDSDL